MERILVAEHETVIAAYEKRIGEREREKLLLEEQLAKTVPPQGRFEDQFELALAFLANPCKLWESGNLTPRMPRNRTSNPASLCFFCVS